jgi:hypothetical protein
MISELSLSELKELEQQRTKIIKEIEQREQPYLEEFREAENEEVELLAAHATTLEKATLILLFQKLLKGHKGAKVFTLVFGHQPKGSLHPTNSVNFSVAEVNKQYSIKNYPPQVNRPHQLGKGEVFFATPLDTITEHPKFEGFKDWGNSAFMIAFFMLEGKRGLIKRAEEEGIELALDQIGDTSEMDRRIAAGKISVDEYEQLLHLNRRILPQTTDQPFRELELEADLDLDNFRLFLPRDFKPAIESLVKQTAEKIKNISAKLAAERQNLQRSMRRTDNAELITHFKNFLQTIDEVAAMQQKLEGNFEQVVETALSKITYYDPDIPTGRTALMHYSHRDRAQELFDLR